MAAEHVLHMQKALDQMNLQIHRALNDITGMSDLRILDAILAGERDPVTLARLYHGGVKNSEDTIAKSVEGTILPRGQIESMREPERTPIFVAAR
jgi:transposase